ncbi:MAG: RNA-binding S4 domain-containing protein [Alphaproteobacteria bacterium]|nr:RNA-binding S4 domain-containing protein [Alphaproteobacteria bacterium]
MSDDGLRLDKWLWFARFCKNRSIAQALCESGRMRISGRVVAKAHQTVRVGDVLTFPLGPHTRVIAVKDLGRRRGPAIEARLLYDDLNPPAASPRPDEVPLQAQREPGAGRPTKAERRAIDRLKGEE